MIEHIGLNLLSGPLAQVVAPGVTTPEEASLIFSGPQFFIALLSGVILAFGFQLLLTNLSVAAGLTYIGQSSSSSSSSSSSGSGDKKIATKFGLWTLITVSLALFFACFLAVKLSLYTSALLGAITGLVVWGTYFCLLFWFSSTTVGSLIGSVVKTATSSFQSLMGAATGAMGAKMASNQLIETAEATAAAVRRELTAGWSGKDIKDTLQEYVTSLASPSLDIEGLEAEFERLLRESDLTSIADRDTLSQLNRDSFEKLVSSRTDLSRKEASRIADRLYGTWSKALGKASGGDSLGELVNYLKSAHPEELLAESLGSRLDEFLGEMRQQRKGKEAKTNPLNQGLTTLMGVVMGRADLSDLDVQKISDRFKQLKNEVTSQVDTVTSEVSGSDRYSVVRADVETYLLNAYPWQLNTQRMQKEFWDVIYDPFADPGLMRQELMNLDQSFFAELLASRGLLTKSEIAEVSRQLEVVRTQALGEVSERYRLEAAKDAQTKVYTFLRQTPREELLSETGASAFSSLLDDPYADADDLQERFSPFTYEALTQTLSTRGDLSEAEIQAVASRLEGVMNNVRANAAGLQSAAKARVENQWMGLQHYLQNTNKAELNPEGIKADIATLLHEPDAGVHRLRQRLAQFDRDTLVQLLNQRQDLSEAEINRTLDQVESTWYKTVNAPGALTAQAKAKYDEATSAIERYLLETGKPELNPEGIKRDLELLVNNPQAGMGAMRDRLSAMDRDTLVQLLSQREDLSEAEANRIIDDVLGTVRDILHMPQRLARRAQAQVVSFETALEDYLRNTDKAALNPDDIKRDLKLLLNDPRLGAERLQARLSRIDRDTVVALLAQRPDMTQAEAEAAVDQVLSVRNQVVSQIRNVQARVTSVVSGIMSRIRNYLDSLGRPELNYYGIRRDLQQLLDDPQAGFESLKVRLGQVDRGTLVALMSSHDAISETDANRIIDQIEDVRNSALSKAEQLEHAVESRLSEIKHQAYQQVEDTRKTAAAASWWIFATATISAIFAAIGGGWAAGT
ncbi:MULTISPECIES: YrzE family protein [Cyanophyceae]|uniref:YrzE family protein n=1 Tax=Leptolyngbya subtilissima DQ-A4 TaxID=2933933 RepID=A0ABV0K1P6_9CYAN|nr:YrzE family protein [Nodosilinea sp. FACHB-141]MBD2111478.1 YrzE family protein [Nodosilinea sp. FACHB-141]